ncbi:MAG: hypothetical protein R8M45_01380 [Ghiorsea sp.]
MQPIHVRRSISLVSLALLAVNLSACGGSESSSSSSGTTASSSTNTIVSLTGVVVDGYMRGARAFLDRNNNGKHETDEPSSLTGNNGQYTLSGLQEGDEHYPVVVDVPASAVDMDNPSQAVGRHSIMSTPAPGSFTGNVVVSPITTMIKATMDSYAGADKVIAEDMIRNKLGVSANLDLFSDYVAKKGAGANSADYAHIHKIAQVVARAVSSQFDTVNTAAKNADGNVTLSDVVAMITNQVVTQLSSIDSQVKATATWDNKTSGDALVTSATVPLDTADANFINQVKNQMSLTLQATQKASAKAQLAAAQAQEAAASSNASKIAAQQAQAAAEQALADTQALLNAAAAQVVADTYTATQNLANSNTLSLAQQQLMVVALQAAGDSYSYSTVTNSTTTTNTTTNSNNTSNSTVNNGNVTNITNIISTPTDTTNTGTTTPGTTTPSQMVWDTSNWDEANWQ